MKLKNMYPENKNKIVGAGLNYYIRNPLTTIALTFLAHIISGIDGVN